MAECAKPGVSMSRLAREVGVNANQPSRWVREHGAQRLAIETLTEAVLVPAPIEALAAEAPAMTMSVQARLPNGVVLTCGVVISARLLSYWSRSGVSRREHARAIVRTPSFSNR